MKYEMMRKAKVMGLAPSCHWQQTSPRIG